MQRCETTGSPGYSVAPLKVDHFALYMYCTLIFALHMYINLCEGSQQDLDADTD